MSPQSMASSGNFPFGIRSKQQQQQQQEPSGALKVTRDSHRIRKPPLPLPQVQYRPPIIIHTYSPKVIHTEPDDFMSLVQKLTGSSDTRLRLKKSPTSRKEKKLVSEERKANLDRQGSGSSTNCGSPSVSEDSSFVVGEQAKEGKQSNSPRSPLDSHFEFDNVSESMFSQFDTASHPFSQVKVEPMFAFHDNQFSFFADHYMHQPRPHVAPPPPLPEQMMANPGYSLMNHTSLQADLSTTAAWSQSFLDCLGAPAPTQYQFHQRQRFSPGAVYAPAPTPESSTMVALESIHAFLST